MNKITQTFQGITGFFGEVKSELKKCAWPTRQELIDSTIIVIISVAMLGLYVGASDVVSMGLIKLIIR